MRLLSALLLSACCVSPQTSDPLFDHQILHEIRLALPAGIWRTLSEKFEQNTYYRADLEWGGRRVQGIGIRSRGSGSRSDVKPGLKVDFGRFDKELRFSGLRSVVLDNLTQDPSMIRERVSMAFFRRMKIPSPREAHARLFVNGQYMGLYGVAEEIDGRFLKRHFGGDGGRLYEYKWTKPYRLEFLGPNASSYSPVLFKPQNKSAERDAEAIVHWIRAVNDASDAEFSRAVSEHLDIPSLLRYLAVENFLAETDGVLGKDGLNNFYLYRPAGAAPFRFIPWDKDVTLHDSAHSIWANVSTNVLMRRAMAIPSWRTAYLDALAECARSAGGTGGWLEAEIAGALRQIRGAALADKRKTYTNEAFEHSGESLIEFARKRADFVLGEVSKARNRR